MARLERHIARAAGRVAPELCVATAAPDHANLRRIVEALSGPDFEVAAVSFDLDEMLLETLDRDLDVVVLHSGDSLASLPPMLTKVSKRLPDVAVVAVCRSYGAQDLRRALGAGLDGLVLDSEMVLALPAAVRAACAGQLSIPRQARPRIYRVALTHAEREVLANVAAGRTNSEIAATLHISPSTVKSRLTSAFAKLGVGSREEAAAAAMDAEGTSPPAR